MSSVLSEIKFGRRKMSLASRELAPRIPASCAHESNRCEVLWRRKSGQNLLAEGVREGQPRPEITPGGLGNECALFGNQIRTSENEFGEVGISAMISALWRA